MNYYHLLIIFLHNMDHSTAELVNLLISHELKIITLYSVYPTPNSLVCTSIMKVSFFLTHLKDLLIIYLNILLLNSMWFFHLHLNNYPII